VTRQSPTSKRTFTIGAYAVEEGARVSCVVVWPGGRQTTSEGSLINVVGAKAYVEISLGAVEVEASSVEPIE
jgi:hypothetical protein